MSVLTLAFSFFFRHLSAFGHFLLLPLLLLTGLYFWPSHEGKDWVILGVLLLAQSFFAVKWTSFLLGAPLSASSEVRRPFSPAPALFRLSLAERKAFLIVLLILVLPILGLAPMRDGFLRDLASPHPQGASVGRALLIFLGVATALFLEARFLFLALDALLGLPLSLRASFGRTKAIWKPLFGYLVGVGLIGAMIGAFLLVLTPPALRLLTVGWITGIDPFFRLALSLFIVTWYYKNARGVK